MNDQIISIDLVRPEDIILAARLAFDDGKKLSDCPYPSDSDAAIRWTKHFIALELAEQGELV